jgi:hypothetical protein
MSIDPEAGGRLGPVAGWVGALRQRRPWAHPRDAPASWARHVGRVVRRARCISSAVHPARRDGAQGERRIHGTAMQDPPRRRCHLVGEAGYRSDDDVADALDFDAANRMRVKEIDSEKTAAKSSGTEDSVAVAAIRRGQFVSAKKAPLTDQYRSRRCRPSLSPGHQGSDHGDLASVAAVPRVQLRSPG